MAGLFHEPSASIGVVSSGDHFADDVLLAEQRDFYRADATPFDGWLGTLLDESNLDPVARTYRAGRERFAEIVGRGPRLGRVLEIAAGTGRLAEVYVPAASSSVLLDSSPESLAIASRRLRDAGDVRVVEADVFDWTGDDERFDTVVFSAWLHHVPNSRFDQFWRTVESVLADGGQVLFDFPDVHRAPAGRTDVPAEPSEEYGLYGPFDGVSIRDHFGRRWRVVHHLWDPEQLAARLDRLGWTMEVLGPGLVEELVWARARR